MSLNELKAADKVVSKILSCSQELVEGAKRAAQQGDSLDSLDAIPGAQSGKLGSRRWSCLSTCKARVTWD